MKSSNYNNNSNYREIYENIEEEYNNEFSILDIYKNNNVEKLKLFLEKNGNPDTYIENETLLHKCARDNKNQIAKILLNYESNPNLKTKTGGNTPIHLAAKYNNSKIVDFIDKYSNKEPDFNLLNNQNETALDIATKLNNKKAIKELNKHGARLNVYKNPETTINEFNKIYKPNIFSNEVKKYNTIQKINQLQKFQKEQKRFVNQIFEHDLKNLDSNIKEIIKRKIKAFSEEKKYYTLSYFLEIPFIYPKIIKKFKAEEWISKTVLYEISKKFVKKSEILIIEKIFKEINSLKQKYSQKEIDYIVITLLKKVQLDNIVDINKIFFIFESLKNNLSQQNFIQNSNVNIIAKYIEKKISNNILDKDQIQFVAQNLKVIDLNVDLINLFCKRVTNKIDVKNIERFFDLVYTLKIYYKNVDLKIKRTLEENYAIKDVNKDLERILLEYRVYFNFPYYKSEITLRIKQLLKLGLSIEYLGTLLYKYKNKTKGFIKKFLEAIEIICDYKLSKWIIKKAFYIIENKNSKQWIPKIHEIAIKNTFIDSNRRTPGEIIQFINKNNENVNLPKNYYQKFLKTLSEKSSIVNIDEKIKYWTKEDIKYWVKKVRYFVEKRYNKEKNTKLTNFISKEEIASVIYRAVELIHKYKPREVQIITLLQMLERNSNLLFKVNTGEGKSDIIYMIATILALEKKQVLIATTSEELSIPESKKQEKFYQLFEITNKENSSRNPTMLKDIYEKSDVIYGKTSKFMGDSLNPEDTGFYLRQQPNQRKKFILVDEVDSLLVDGKGHRVQISQPHPGMNHLEILMAVIWNHVLTVCKQIFKYKKRWYCCTEEFIQDEKTQEIKLKTSNKNLDNCIIGINDRYKFTIKNTKAHLKTLLRKLDIEEKKEWDEYQNLEKWYIKQLHKVNTIEDAIERDRALKKLSKDYDYKFKNLLWIKNNRKPILEIPKYQRKYVEENLETFIKNAASALYFYKRHKNYDVIEGKIIPIDYSGTGEYQNNTILQDGLNQFLQIQEGLKFSPESVAPKFISNVEFFISFGNNLIGLSGTLGTKPTRKLLEKTYNVKNITIPPFKKIVIASNKTSDYICKELSALVIENKDTWLDTIVRTNLRKLKNNRAVLIICQYVNQVIKLRDIFKKHGYKKIYLYTGEKEFKKHQLYSGDLIIATNVAGRGTDLKTNKSIEDNGGLHVSITYLPINLRVEKQNAGRTSRKGNKGSTQLIIYDPLETPIEILKERRKKRQERNLKKALREIDEMLIRDKFCNKFEKITSKFLKKEDKNLKKAVTERWGFWLNILSKNIQKNSEESFKKEEYEKQFEEFILQIKKDFKEGNLIENPYFHIKEGNDIIFFRKDIIGNRLTEAIKEYDKAIRKDPSFALNAHYNKAYALLRYSGKTEDKIKAKKELLIAKYLANMYNKNVMCFHELIRHKSKNTKISEQVKANLIILSKQKECIDRAIFIIEKALKNNWELNIETNKISTAFLKDKNKENEKNNLNSTDEKIEETIEIIEKKYKDEIDEFRRNGLEHFFELYKRPPPPKGRNWLGLTTVGLLGVAQVLVGASITIFSLGSGSALGNAIMSEGISDLIYVVKSGWNNNFDWEQWALQKSISYSVSLITAGLSTLKNSFNSLKAGAKALLGITKGEVAKQGIKLAGKNLGHNLAKSLTRECLKSAISYGAEKLFINKIEGEIFNTIKNKIIKSLQNDCYQNDSLVLKTFQIDALTNNNDWQNKILNIGQNILEPRKPNWFTSYLIGTAKGLAQSYDKTLGHFIKGYTIQKTLHDILALTDKFLDKFYKDIENIYGNQIVDELNYFIDQKIDYKISRKTNQYNRIKRSIENDINLDFNNIKYISKSLSDSLVAQILNKCQQNIIQPVINLGVEYSIDAINKKGDEIINKEINDFKALHTVIMFQNELSRNKIDAGDLKFKKNNIDPDKKDFVIEMLEDCRGNLLHLGSLSKELKKRIEVYNEKNNLLFIIGEEYPVRDCAKFKYTKPNNENPWGHWNPLGVIMGNKGIGDCLFETAAFYSDEREAEYFRNIVANNIVENYETFLNYMPAIDRLRSLGDGAIYLGGGYNNSFKTNNILQKEYRKFLKEERDSKLLFLIKRGRLSMIENVLLNENSIKIFQNLSERFIRYGLRDYILGKNEVVTINGISNYLKKIDPNLSSDDYWYGGHKIYSIGNFNNPEFYELIYAENSYTSEEKESEPEKKYYWGDDIKVIGGNGKYRKISKFCFKKLSNGRKYVTEKDIEEYNRFSKELLNNPELLKKAKSEVESKLIGLKDVLEGIWVLQSQLSSLKFFYEAFMNRGKGANITNKINSSNSALNKASKAAFESVKKAENIFIKDKHLNIGSGKFSKFNTKDINEVRKWIQDGLKSYKTKFIPNPNLKDTFISVIDAGKVIGTKGQTQIKVIIGLDGKVINAFPIK